MMELWQALKRHTKSGKYPFHMPGHKGGRLGIFSDMMRQDITEIEGFDNLHKPEGILLNAQKRCAGVFGAEESFFLINGSTSGILAAMMSCCNENQEILIARNCHRSVYSGLIFSGAKPIYILPEMLKGKELFGSITIEQVKKTIEKYPNAKALLLTSPTYEGITSDIENIAHFLHQKNMVLIVDEAHGSHMKFHDFFPKTALQQGADIVIQSLHKTLPSPTQTALLHIQGKRADRKKVKQALSMVQSSSPSYLFLAAMDACCGWLQKQGKKEFESYVKKLQWFYKRASNLENIVVLQKAGFDRDRGKIVLQLPKENITGIQLNDLLRRNFAIEMEMGSLSYSIAMTSPADTKEGFCRLVEAIEKIDKQLSKTKKHIFSKIEEGDCPPIIKTTPRRAYFAQKKEILFLESENHVCGEFIIPYPPGAPILAPGEVITKEKIQKSILLQKAGVSFVGCQDTALKNITVLAESE